MRNRDRLLKQRAQKATGRDFDKELGDLNRRKYELEQDRKHDEWNANRKSSDLNEYADRAEKKLTDSGHLQGGILQYNPLTNPAVPDYYKEATYAREQARQTTVNSRQASNRSIQQQNLIQNEINKTQREYGAAITAASKTPISRIEEAAYNATRAVTAALDKISDVTMSALSKLKK